MRRLQSLWRNLFRRREFESDLDNEIESYIELVTDEKIASGLSPADARRAARVQLGGAESVKEAVRSASAGSLLRELWQDLQYTVRTLQRQRGFLCVSVMTIALGIGVNASIFSILNGLLLRPLPIAGSNSLVSIFQKLQGAGPRVNHGGLYRLSYAEYSDYRDNNSVFTGMVAYHPELRVLVNDSLQETESQAVSCNYFNVLQPAMTLGRGFADAECRKNGSAQVAVLSNDFWKEQFAGDPQIVGRTVKLNRIPVTIIGVAAAGFAGADVVRSALWVPLPMMGPLSGKADGIDFTAPNVAWLEVMGRRRSGVSMQEVRANLSVIARHIDQQHPGRTTIVTAETSAFLQAPNERKAVMGAGAAVLIAVAMVLMIACANLANLMLARSVSRAKEIAMRLALGASRSRIVRQLVTEALFIAALGGALGALLAAASGPLLWRVLLEHLPPGVSPLQVGVTADTRVLAYAFLLTLLSGLAFGLAPALQGTRPDLNTVLKQESAGVDVVRPRGIFRGILIGGQVAVCMVLLVASGLLVRALLRAQTVDPGFNMRGIAVLSYDLARVGYNNAQAAAFNQALMERLQSLPGESQAVLAGGSPLGQRHFITGFNIAGRRDAAVASYLEVSAGFFSLIDLPLLKGRDFTYAEVARGASLAIVSESFARSTWPGEDPIGKVMRRGPGKTDIEVIGVARDAEVGELGDTDKAFVYLPPARDEAWTMQTVMVHYDGDFASAANSLRAVAKRLDPALKIEVQRLEDNLGPYQTISRITAEVASLLGFLALALAMVGLYGTVSYGVNRRTREIGLRIALGARSADVLGMMIKQSLRPVLIGAAAGIVLCAGTSSLLSKLLFGVSPHDAVAFTAVPALMLAIAVIAIWLPARRALLVDPVVALREN